jgi:hypothetical protein
LICKTPVKWLCQSLTFSLLFAILMGGGEGKSLRIRRDGRVDYGDGLESRCGRKVTGGSNPSPSAKSDNCKWPVRGDARVDEWDRLLSG